MMHRFRQDGVNSNPGNRDQKIIGISIPHGHGSPKVPSNKPGNMKTDPNRSRPEHEVSNSSPAVGWIIGCSILGVIAIGLAIALVLVLRQRMKIPHHAPLQRTLDDRVNTLTLSDLKRKSAEVIGNPGASERVVSIIADDLIEQIDAETGEIKALETRVRYPNIKLRCSTQVVLRKQQAKKGGLHGLGLHMSKMHDYYGDTVLMCQAPLPEQFTDQWRAIWQEKIGLVVWIGHFVENDVRKMDPYIPLAERQCVTYDNFQIRTMAIVRRPYEYDQYLVRVQKTKKSTAKLHTRELIIIHVHFWPDNSMPFCPAKLADLVDRLKDHHERLIEKHLRGLLVHCSAGVQRTPALVAVYIGRQLWRENRKVNVIGILRYIRRQRYKAFGFGKPELQIKIVFGLMQIMAMRMEFYSNLAKRIRGRQDPFEEQWNRSSWEGVDSKSTISSSSETELNII